MKTAFWIRSIAAVATTALVAISLVAQTASSQGSPSGLRFRIPESGGEVDAHGHRSALRGADITYIRLRHKFVYLAVYLAAVGGLGAGLHAGSGVRAVRLQRLHAEKR